MICKATDVLAKNFGVVPTRASNTAWRIPSHGRTNHAETSINEWFYLVPKRSGIVGKTMCAENQRTIPVDETRQRNVIKVHRLRDVHVRNVHARR